MSLSFIPQMYGFIGAGDAVAAGNALWASSLREDWALLKPLGAALEETNPSDGAVFQEAWRRFPGSGDEDIPEEERLRLLEAGYGFMASRKRLLHETMAGIVLKQSPGRMGEIAKALGENRLSGELSGLAAEWTNTPPSEEVRRNVRLFRLAREFAMAPSRAGLAEVRELVEAARRCMVPDNDRSRAELVILRGGLNSIYLEHSEGEVKAAAYQFLGLQASAEEAVGLLPVAELWKMLDHVAMWQTIARLIVGKGSAEDRLRLLSHADAMVRDVALEEMLEKGADVEAMFYFQREFIEEKLKWGDIEAIQLLGTLASYGSAPAREWLEKLAREGGLEFQAAAFQVLRSLEVFDED